MNVCDFIILLIGIVFVGGLWWVRDG